MNPYKYHVWDELERKYVPSRAEVELKGWFGFVHWDNNWGRAFNPNYLMWRPIECFDKDRYEIVKPAEDKKSGR
jgi:hypothetical protein